MAYVVTPVQVTDEKLIASNIPEPDTANGDPAAYVAATTYAEGDQVTVVATHKVYESLEDDNVGNYPPDDVEADDPKWTEVRATNRWKVFDPYANTRSEQSSSITFSVDATRTSTVALLNVEGTSVDFSLRDTDDVVILSETVSLTADTCADWFDYFFSEIEYRDKVFWNYPVGYGTKLRVSVTSTGTVRLGLMRHGLMKYIGEVAQEVSTGILDFSVKTENDYGYVFLQQREYRDVIDVSLYINNAATDNISRHIKGLRAIPSIWILDNEEDLNDSMNVLSAFGFIKDFGVVVKSKHPNSYDLCNLTIESLL